MKSTPNKHVPMYCSNPCCEGYVGKTCCESYKGGPCHTGYNILAQNIILNVYNLMTSRCKCHKNITKCINFSKNGTLSCPDFINNLNTKIKSSNNKFKKTWDNSSTINVFF